MALTFRNINKFCNILSITTPRPPKFRRNYSLKPTTSSYEQYFSRDVLNCPETNCVLRAIPRASQDNRELESDVIKRESVLRFAEDFKKEDSDGRPQPEKLKHVYDVLAADLPNLFSRNLNYTIYHNDIIFEDNIRNVTTKGLYSYVKQMAFIRTVGHLKFGYVNLVVLKITQHPEEGTIKVRWRVRGVSGLKILLKFWKIKLWHFKETLEKSETWYDGFSTFYVNADGKVIKHVADKMMPDDDRISSPASPVDIHAAKLALIVGVIPKFSDFSSLT